MVNIDTICLNCMTDKGDKDLCSNCGHVEFTQSSSLALPVRTLLKDRFLVGRVLGRPGGFGITYQVWDRVLETVVAIKEFMPLSAVSRVPGSSVVLANSEEDRAFFAKGLHIFLQEAKTLAQFSHPNIIRIKDYFRTNNTAYLVMEYCRGVALDQHIRERGGRLTEDRAWAIMSPILDGLEAVHQRRFLHRDIKPQNIYLTDSGLPILLDFGAARLLMLDTTNTLTVMLSRGFAPFEQYHKKGKQGPWSDLYACGATLYFMVTGKVPSDAIERQHSDTLIPPIKLNPGLSERFSRAIMKAMAIDPSSRPQNVEQFRMLFTGPSSKQITMARQTPYTTAIQTAPHTPAIANPAPQPEKPPVIIRYPTERNGFTLKKLALMSAIGTALAFGWNSESAFKATKPAASPPAAEANMDENASDIERESVDSFQVRASKPAPDHERAKSRHEFSKPRPEAKIIEDSGFTPASTLDPKPTERPLPRPDHRPPPPLHAVTACERKLTHAPCRIDTPRSVIKGVCLPTRNERLACFPNKPPPPTRFYSSR